MHYRPIRHFVPFRLLLVLPLKPGMLLQGAGLTRHARRSAGGDGHVGIR